MSKSQKVLLDCFDAVTRLLWEAEGAFDKKLSEWDIFTPFSAGYEKRQAMRPYQIKIDKASYESRYNAITWDTRRQLITQTEMKLIHHPHPLSDRNSTYTDMKAREAAVKIHTDLQKELQQYRDEQLEAMNKMNEAGKTWERAKEELEIAEIPYDRKIAEAEVQRLLHQPRDQVAVRNHFDKAMQKVKVLYLKYIEENMSHSPIYAGATYPLFEILKKDVCYLIVDISDSLTTNDLRVFAEVEKRMIDNYKVAEAHTPGFLTAHSPLTPKQVVEAVFKGTPLLNLFTLNLEGPEPMTPDILEQYWYGHCLLLAQTRLGKTNVIRWRILYLLPLIAQGKASIVLMEPKGVLTSEILHLAYLWGMRDRVVIIDPLDTNISVNVFDKGDGSDHAINETIARVLRVLETVTMALTPFQKDALTYALRAMFCIDAPGSMRLLTSILRQGIKELPVQNLPYVVQEFFEHDFKAGDGSSQQVISRLNGLLSNPIFEALFAAERSTLDLLTEIQAGKLIVINASAGDMVYAKFWIEQMASCVSPRFKIPEASRTPTTFIIDEAQTWISEDLNFAGILDKAAEAKIGMLIACHHMGQITNLQVRGSIYTNTTLKFTARTAVDVNNLSNSMGFTEPDFIRTIPLYQFAYFGPNMDRAIKVKFPLVEFAKMPHMTEAQYDEMRAENRRKYSYVRPDFPQNPPNLPKVDQNHPKLPKPSPEPPEPEDHDDSGGVGYR